MSTSEKQRFNPNATIQLTVDEVQLADLAAQNSPPDPVAPGRSAPPPLPATPQTGSAPPPAGVRVDALPAPGGAGQPTGRTARTVAYTTLAMALVALAVVAGLKVGEAARRPASGGTGPASSASAGPSGSATGVMTLPTIEMH